MVSCHDRASINLRPRWDGHFGHPISTNRAISTWNNRGRNMFVAPANCVYAHLKKWMIDAGMKSIATGKSWVWMRANAACRCVQVRRRANAKAWFLIVQCTIIVNHQSNHLHTSKSKNVTKLKKSGITTRPMYWFTSYIIAYYASTHVHCSTLIELHQRNIKHNSTRLQTMQCM